MKSMWSCPSALLCIWCVLVWGATPLAESEISTNSQESRPESEHLETEVKSGSVRPPEGNSVLASQRDEELLVDSEQVPTFLPPVDEDPLPVPPLMNERDQQSLKEPLHTEEEAIESSPSLEKASPMGEEGTCKGLSKDESAAEGCGGEEGKNNVGVRWSSGESEGEKGKLRDDKNETPSTSEAAPMQETPTSTVVPYLEAPPTEAPPTEAPPTPPMLDAPPTPAPPTLAPPTIEAPPTTQETPLSDYTIPSDVAIPGRNDEWREQLDGDRREGRREGLSSTEGGSETKEGLDGDVGTVAGQVVSETGSKSLESDLRQDSGGLGLGESGGDTEMRGVADTKQEGVVEDLVHEGTGAKDAASVDLSGADFAADSELATEVRGADQVDGAGDVDRTDEVGVDGGSVASTRNGELESGLEHATTDHQEPGTPETVDSAETADSAVDAAAEGGEQSAEEEEEEEEEEDGQVLTFEEFKKKMREQEGGQVLQRSVEEAGPGGVASKRAAALTNYASFDCGAKVIETNRETQNSMAILLENRDAYMINPCSANITFVVELCEMVSVRTLEIACFELFSSIPKSFKVYSSDSYPTAEWNDMGTFVAPNDRTIHPFPLDNVYAKFIKVVMLSHYGDEHYCPLSLLRVMGASMMEVYEESESQKAQGGGNGHASVPSMTLPPSEGLTEEDAAITGTGTAMEQDMEVDDNETLLGAATGAVLRVLEKPLRFLGKMNLIKPDEEAEPAGDPEPPTEPHSEDAYSNLGGSYLPPGGTESPADGADNCTSSEAGDLQRFGDGVDQPKADLMEKAVASSQQASEEEGASNLGGGGGSDKGLSGDQQRGLNLDGSPLPHDYSTITSHGKPGGQALHGVREEQLPDLPSSGSREEAVVSPATNGDAESADSAIDPAPVRESSAQGSSLEATLESLGPSNLVPESDSVQESGSIPSLGPDLLGPEPEIDSKTDSSDSSGAEEKNGRSTTLHKGSSADSDSGVVPSAPTSSDESSAISTGRDDDSAFNRARLPSNTHDTISENRLDSESRETESPASGISLEQFNNTDVNPSRLEPDEGGGREEGFDTPLTAADSSGMEREEVDSQQHQTIDGIDGRQLSGALPAASAGHGDTVSEPGGNSDSTRHDHIPANNDSVVTTDLEPLGHQPSNLPNDASLSSENADSVTGGSSGPSGQTGADLGNGSSVSCLESSSKHTADVGAPSNGNETADLGSRNGNQTAANLGGPNGTGMGVSASQGGSVQNQTEGASSRNGNQTGNGGSGLGNGLPAQQKEKSVFLRLSNHINDLEANMTLFSIFLDQISTSLKKNKNKTEETTKWLDRRLTSLNESILNLKRNVSLKLEMFAELRGDVLALVESVSQVSNDLLDLRVEVYVVVMMMAVLQLTILFITLFSCTWQCYNNRILRSQIRTLQKARHSLPPSPQSEVEVESLGQSPPGNDSVILLKGGSASELSAASKASGSSVRSAESVWWHVRKSSSTSQLSDLDKPTKKIQAKLSRSGGLVSNGRGVPPAWSVGGMGINDDSLLASSSASNIEEFTGSASLRTSGFSKRKKHNRKQSFT